METDRKEASEIRELFDVKMENFVHMQSTRTGRKYLRVIYICSWVKGAQRVAKQPQNYSQPILCTLIHYSAAR